MADEELRETALENPYLGKLGVHDPSIRQENLRIEALRAASRVVGGAYSGGKSVVAGENDEQSSAGGVTISLAEQFARWLETGDR